MRAIGSEGVDSDPRASRSASSGATSTNTPKEETRASESYAGHPGGAEIMSTDNASPVRPEIRLGHNELLVSAASLLRVGVRAFGERGDVTVEDDDLLEVIATAKERVESFVDGVANMEIADMKRVRPVRAPSRG